jgi:hypothetical protein
MKKFILLILFGFISIAYAQVDTTNIQQNFESVLEDAIEGKETSEVYDVLEFLSQNKIPINSASINDLVQIPFLDRTAATAIIRHRNVLGGIYNIDQLRFIDNVSFDLIEKILPFIKLGDEQPVTFNEIFDNKFQLMNLSYRTRGSLDLQKEEGYRDGTFPDSRWKIYNRLILSKANKIRAGILIEKDPGEKQLNDFTTFHLSLKDLDILKNLVIGDYLFEFGQGLALWSRYAFSKGSDAISVLPRNGRGLVPYLSSDENQFLRGIAATTKYNNFSFSGFFSSRFLDGNIDSTTNQITSFRIDGLHRIQNELNKKDLITEKMFGASAGYNFGDIGNFSALLYHIKYGNDFEYNSLLDPVGSDFNYFSTSYNLTYLKISLSGETAFSNRSFATLNTAAFSVDKNFSFLVSYRYYGEEYWNLHSSGFGERDYAQNESGFYAGIKYKTLFGTVNFYFDQFKFFYVGDQFRFPANGTDFMIYYEYKPYKSTEVRLRYKNEQKEILEQVVDVYGLVSSKKENLRGEFIYTLSKQVQLHSRIEFVSTTPAAPNTKDYGYLLFQDVRYKPINALSFSVRVIFFKTDSYNSRVYEYENDLPGVMTSPALTGDGMRWYLNAKYDAPFGLSLSAKYSELIKPGEKFMGSGSSLIYSSVDNRFSLQLDYQL